MDIPCTLDNLDHMETGMLLHRRDEEDNVAYEEGMVQKVSHDVSKEAHEQELQCSLHPFPLMIQEILSHSFSKLVMRHQLLLAHFLVY